MAECGNCRVDRNARCRFFGGGIGEHSCEIRRRIVLGLEWVGVTIDEEKNRAGDAASIGAAGSRAAVEVVRVDEASVLAEEAAALLRRAP